MAETFEEYQAEYAKAPFPFPMPGGASVLVVQPDLTTERAAVAAANAGGNLADGLLKGLLVYVGDADRQAVTEAWGTLPSSALNAVIGKMREYFGSKN